MEATDECFPRFQSAASCRAQVEGIKYNSFFVNPLAEGCHEEGPCITYAGATVAATGGSCHNPLAEEYEDSTTPPASPTCVCLLRPTSSLLWHPAADLLPSESSSTTAAAAASVRAALSCDAPDSPGVDRPFSRSACHLPGSPSFAPCTPEPEPTSQDSRLPQQQQQRVLQQPELAQASSVGGAPTFAPPPAPPDAVLSGAPSTEAEPLAPRTPPLPAPSAAPASAHVTASTAGTAPTRPRSLSQNGERAEPRSAAEGGSALLPGQRPAIPPRSWPCAAGPPPRWPKYSAEAAAANRRVSRVNHLSVEDAVGQRLADAALQPPGGDDATLEQAALGRSLQQTRGSIGGGPITGQRQPWGSGNAPGRDAIEAVAPAVAAPTALSLGGPPGLAAPCGWQPQRPPLPPMASRTGGSQEPRRAAGAARSGSGCIGGCDGGEAGAGTGAGTGAGGAGGAARVRSLVERWEAVEGDSQRVRCSISSLAMTRAVIRTLGLLPTAGFKGGMSVVDSPAAGGWAQGGDAPGATALVGTRSAPIGGGGEARHAASVAD